MPPKKDAMPSPFFQPSSNLGAFKAHLLQHLELLRMPYLNPNHESPCDRDCHIIERNHTLEVLRELINK